MLDRWCGEGDRHGWKRAGGARARAAARIAADSIRQTSRGRPIFDSEPVSVRVPGLDAGTAMLQELETRGGTVVATRHIETGPDARVSVALATDLALVVTRS